MDNLLARAGFSLLVVSLVVLASFLLRSFRAIDRFYQYEYENCHDQWERDGEPRGYFWKPPQSSNVSYKLLFRRLLSPANALVLVFVTPAWAKPDAAARKILKDLRHFVLLWNLGVVVWIGLLIALPLFIFGSAPR